MTPDLLTVPAQRSSSPSRPSIAKRGRSMVFSDVRVTAPAAGDYLQWNATTSRWENRALASFNVLTASSWVPALGDVGAFMVLTNGSTDTTIAIPADASVAFPIGTELHIHQDGTGLVTVTGDAGVTMLKHVSLSNHLLGQYATATVKKTAVNVWRLFGLLAGRTPQ